ncbi:MAG: glycerophosphodiester phosphodiesterase [Gemmatimonadetes bacterium]|nr:glycerophosphodiester phosphodiesterase [Gemmatimonadota bacterium]
MPRRERENTLPSFAAALAAGAQGIELDVHATADGIVVVHHDPVTSAGGEIATTLWSELNAAHGPAIASTNIPSLAEVCDLVGDRAALFVEIKGEGIEEAVTAVLDGRRGTFAIHSFDHATIGRLARARVPYRLGLLFDDSVDDAVERMAEYGAADAWPHRSLVDRPLVERIQRSGGRVIAWTVNSASDARRLAGYGIDGICTDDVTLLDVLDT